MELDWIFIKHKTELLESNNMKFMWQQNCSLLSKKMLSWAWPNFMTQNPTVAKKQHEVSATKDTVYHSSQKKLWWAWPNFIQHKTSLLQRNNMKFTILWKSSDGLNPISYKMKPCSLLQKQHQSFLGPSSKITNGNPEALLWFQCPSIMMIMMMMHLEDTLRKRNGKKKTPLAEENICLSV